MGKSVILGTLNSGLSSASWFVAAIRLPGGVTASDDTQKKSPTG